MEKRIKLTEEERLFDIRALYSTYLHFYRQYKQAPSANTKTKVARDLENCVKDRIKGKKTGLISKEALALRIKVSQKLINKSQAMLSTEHPITYKSICKYILEQPKRLSAEEFYNLWHNNLITVVTTRKQNYDLMKLQKYFVFPTDDWKEMYTKLSIILYNDPNFKKQPELKKLLEKILYEGEENDEEVYLGNVSEGRPSQVSGSCH